MRYFDSYTFYDDLQRDEKKGFEQLKSEKPQYIAHTRKVLEKHWKKLPKKRYISRYHSRSEPGKIIPLKDERVFFIFTIEKSEQKIGDSILAKHETDLVFINDNFSRLITRTEIHKDKAEMSFRCHKLTDERMLTILKKNGTFRKFINRMNEVV